MAVTGNFWDAWDVILVLGVLTLLWLVVLLLEELLLRVRARRAVQRVTGDSWRAADRARVRQSLR